VIDIGNEEITTQLYPNPVYEDATLKITSKIKAEYFWQLSNTTGELMDWSSPCVIFPGNNKAKIPAVALPPGMYYLQIGISTHFEPLNLYTIKLIKI
jgi:hypothetical protein